MSLPTPGPSGHNLRIDRRCERGHRRLAAESDEDRCDDRLPDPLGRLALTAAGRSPEALASRDNFTSSRPGLVAE